MAVSRAAAVDTKFIAAVKSMSAGPIRRDDLDMPVREGTTLTARKAIELFEDQIGNRHLDFAARELRAREQGFYTIGSSGHEGNAAVAANLRHTDMAFLHYRSGAFFLQRARQVPGTNAYFDILLGMCAAKDEPIAGGRHKVFGSKPLNVPPQTSTIASQLPKAVGVAMTLDRRKKLGLPMEHPADAIVVVSFGDASVNHAVAQTALNAASYSAHRNAAVPILFLCEDNGIGISVSTPKDWVRDSCSQRPHIKYVFGNGLDLPHVFDAAAEAVQYVRTRRRPAFLHVQTVRLMGHAGSDVEQLYRTPEQIAENEAKDPLIATARLLVENGWLTPEAVLALYERVRDKVMALVEDAMQRPRLTSAADIIAPLAPIHPERIAAEVSRPADPAARQKFWDGMLPESDKPRHLAVCINRALGDILVKYPNAMIFGEDVAQKGGVYHVTTELQKRAGVGRVFDTLLDETTILGLALGAAHLGALPIPEIQYLAYFHNAEDQIRGEACSLQYFSQGQFKNPCVVRIAGYAYQKGFGGHFHNDNSIAVLRDIPGLVIASPARGDDAVRMLRTCVAAAKADGAVCVFLEPIALYMTKDLHEKDDNLWCASYPAPGSTDDTHIPIGSGRVHGDGKDLTVVSFANGLWMSLRVAKRLEAKGVKCRVLDLRWLNPLPVADLLREAKVTGRVLVVDETRRTGGVSEAVFTALIDGGYSGRLARVASQDTYIPLGEAANLVLVGETDIEAAALKLVGP